MHLRTPLGPSGMTSPLMRRVRQSSAWIEQLLVHADARSTCPTSSAISHARLLPRQGLGLTLTLNPKHITALQAVEKVALAAHVRTPDGALDPHLVFHLSSAADSPSRLQSTFFTRPGIANFRGRLLNPAMWRESALHPRDTADTIISDAA